MLKKTFVMTVFTIGMIVSASVHADLVIKAGYGQTQSLPDTTVQTHIDGGPDWPIVSSWPAPWDSQLGYAILKTDDKKTLSCQILGRITGYSPLGEPILRHIFTCDNSRLNTDSDLGTILGISGCEVRLHETMHVVAPTVTVPANPLDPSSPLETRSLNTGIFQNVTGGTLEVEGILNVCTKINTFKQVSGIFVESAM